MRRARVIIALAGLLASSAIAEGPSKPVPYVDAHAHILRSLSPDETPTFGPMPEALKARIEGREATHPD